MRKLIVTILSAAVMVAQVIPVYAGQIEADIKAATINEIENNAITMIPNVTYTEIPALKQNEIWYKVTVPSGKLTINVSTHEDYDQAHVNREVSLFKSGDYANYLAKASGHTITDLYNRVCDPGVYYIKVVDHYPQFYSDSASGYYLTVNLDSNEQYEMESNDTIRTSNPIKFGNVYKGDLLDKNDVDYYKFSVVEDGYIIFTCGPDASADPNELNYGWYFDIVDQDNNEYSLVDLYAATKTHSAYALAEGDYYVRVCGNSFLSSFPKGLYNIKLDFYPDKTWEHDGSNEDVEHAEQIPACGYINGTIHKEDTDWYTFTLSKKATVKMSALLTGSFKDTPSVCCVLRDADSDLKQIESKTNSTASVELAAGTYYVKVTGNYGTQYKLSVSSSGIVSAISEKKLSKPASLKAVAGKKKVTLKWKKCTGAAKYQIYRSTKKSSGYKKIGTTKKTSYVDKNGIKSKKTYYYKIRAKSGNVVSKYSSVVKAKVK